MTNINSLNDTKEYDIILYGATGYTASYIIPYLENTPLKICLAARDIRGDMLKSSLPNLLCDLKEAPSKARVLINCVGPYHSTAEEVIKSCIFHNTHYMDLCGETQFLKYIRMKYKNVRNISIVQACGFDSMIADLGLIYLKSFFDRDFNIRSVLELSDCVVNRGTWDTLIDSIKNNKMKFNSKLINKRSTSEYLYDSSIKSYIVKFRGSDHFVVSSTQKGSCKYEAYLKIGSLYNLILYYIYFFFITLVSKRLLKKYYRFFSRSFVVDRPDSCLIKKGSFKMTLHGVGMKNTEYISKSLVIKGPDPGYITTAICVSQASFLLKKAMGVVTPGEAFKDTNLREKLSEYGITFDILD